MNDVGIEVSVLGSYVFVRASHSNIKLTADEARILGQKIHMLAMTASEASERSAAYTDAEHDELYEIVDNLPSAFFGGSNVTPAK